MPALTIRPEQEGFICRFFAPWEWAPRKGNPAQAYGEPFPDNIWILERAIELYEHRRAKMFQHADAVRQWLLDYGMTVEIFVDNGVRVKW